MELRLPLEMSPGREAACRAVFGKLTKPQIAEKRDELTRTLLKLDALDKHKKALVNELDDDFAANEAKYREGVRTASGILYRKPSFKCTARPAVEVA